MLRRTLRRAVPETVEPAVQYDMPILQRVRYVGRPVSLRFAEDAAAWIAHDEEVRVKRAHQGLELQGVNEEALTRAVALLCKVFGDDIQPMPAQVHYIDAAQLLEPIMHLRIDCAADHCACVSNVLAARSVPILAEEAQDDVRILRGTAPLALLLGLEAQLLASGVEGASFWSWLSHYAPAGPHGGDAA